MDKSKIPSTTKYIIENYLSKIFPRAEFDTLVLPVLMATSQILCHNRVTIQNEILFFDNVIPNIYILSFSNSGSGKDRTTKTIEKLMRFFETIMQKDFAFAKNIHDQEIERLAEIECNTATKKADYIAKNSMRYLKPNITSESTPEGFIDQRSAFFDAQLGYTQWVDSEIYDSLKWGLDHSFIKLNKEAFDHGKTEDKTLKGSKKPRKFNVPHLVSIHGAIDDSEKEDRFKSFFDLGFARRSFLVMAKEQEEFVEISKEEKKKLASIAISEEEGCIKLLEGISDKVRIVTKYATDNTKIYSIEDDAVDLYMEYENKCDKRAFDKKGINSAGVVAENRHRHWKMMKLACVIAAQENSKLTIRKQDVEMAIYLSDYYGEHFEKFYFKDNVIVEDKIVDMFLRNKEVTKYDIKRQNFFPCDEIKQDQILDKLFKLKTIVDQNGEQVAETLEVKETLKWAIAQFSKEIVYRKEKGMLVLSAVDFIPMEKPEHYDAIKAIVSINDDPGAWLALRGKYGNEAIDLYLEYDSKN